MTRVKYEVDYKAIEQIEEKFKKIPNNIEGIINSYLHNEGAAKTVKHITHLMPISIRDKRHARNSKWWKIEDFNLGFTVKARGGAASNPGSFGYLVFPNEGRGPHNPLEQRFMEGGLESSINDILFGRNSLNDHIDRYLEEEF
ncbi:hypothetical protein KO561_05325 [Radiobacillus kanasensis]|uniref:hypothetical protein n=1 Tax=Radiobacillus kanasensis TaxID=2844358 RepID=UPI001E3C0886|nr:hypothetical protein [Radiobacillus kanasensis]UFU00368.1 hypothetical protein KO561_05325 [Radiobacillus kanasensis]